MPRSELSIPPDIRYVGLARHAIVTAARAAGMDQERSEDLRIAVSEATTNAILAHRADSSDSSVVLEFGTNERKEFQVTIADAGPGFDPEPDGAAEGRDWRIEGGLGITLIRGLADDVEFVRGEGMKVHLRFAVSLDVHGGGGPDRAPSTGNGRLHHERRSGSPRRQDA